ncbi:MAG: hypothetical protein AMXMBFR33_37050 [Candidatus Xenobia bacterium]
MSGECPYLAREEHPLADPAQGRCSECGRPLVSCAHCHTPNRVLARYCRHCGSALQSRGWSTRGGQSGAPALRASLALDSDLPAAWVYQSSQSQPVAGSPLVTSELMVRLDRQGRVEIFAAPTGPAPLHSKPLPGVTEVVASPALLDELLLVAAQDRLYAADLVDLLEVSPGSGTRKRVIELQGNVCSHVASDGRRYAALATSSEDSAWLHVFELTRQGLQLLWKRSPGRLHPEHAFLALAIVGDHLLAAEGGGSLFSYHIPDGRSLGEARLPTPLAPCPLLGRTDFALVAASDGALYRLDPAGGAPLAICEPSPQPLFALGASQEDVVSCHGRMLRRVNLHSGRVSHQQIPQHCTSEPLVVGNRALVAAADGTAYLLELSPDHFQVLASRKVLSPPEPGGVSPVLTSTHLFVSDAWGGVAALPLQV